MNSTQKLIKNKMGLLNLAEELGNVSKACKVMGFSRDTFYRYRELVDEGGIENLVEKTRRKANHKNRIDQTVEDAVNQIAVEFPAFGQVRASNELRKRGIFISAAGVRCAWVRSDLETFKNRLKALDRKVQEEGIVLTESQMIALEKKKDDDVAFGEIETAHPGYLGSQDTFYVGCLKCVGRIYQQTFVDTYSKIAICKLYTTKTPITAADLLNGRGIPFFDQYHAPVLRILTDRGTEYCGKPDSHDFQLYLAMCDIEHTKTKVRHPQTSGICERFHRTILNEFYQVTFRKKIYQTLEELQIDLDVRLAEYNNERTHQGKICLGRTPLATFLDGLKTVREKMLN
ncbi:IS481 family transposase [Oligoflexus tunisiensis]|uniref:IS481 family transposase n=1 Tax=Oligoflexus tunisiensis TaxID=708132 RepID=UPI000A765BD4|nr:IS481 family transposase [Oligoflexus tunisiensis]